VTKVTDMSLSVRQAFKGRHILVAGASGFLGKVWLAMVLRRLPDVGKVYVLLRGQGRRSARERFEKIARHSPAFKPLHDEHGARLGAFLSDRVEVVEGDLTRDRLGIAPDVLLRLRERLDLIVHSAALLEFEPELGRAVTTNVTGSLRMLELAQSCDRAALLDVSTCYVAGDRGGRIPEQVIPSYCPSGEPFDAEAEYRDCLRALERGKMSVLESVKECERRARRWGWSNGYQYTKSLAESLLRARAGDLPYAIVRPSIVECALDFPFPGWNEGYHGIAPVAYLAQRWLRHIPLTPHHVVDTVPVDQVGNGLTTVAAALLERRHQTVYHLGTSDRNPATRGRWLELMALSHRGHQRQGARPLDRLLSLWDAVPARPGALLSAENLQRAVTSLAQIMEAARQRAPEGLALRLDSLGAKLDRASSELERARGIFEVLAPFLQRTAGVFECRAIDRHVVAEREFRFDPGAIDWRDYVLRVQMPGLRRWCFPIFEGRRVERLEPAYPVRLTPSAPPLAAQAAPSRAVAGRAAAGAVASYA
jgi:long-chain acyl-CoA synthetase